MKTMIKNTIDTLRDKVKANLMQIQNNQKEIRELLKQPVSPKRTELLETKYTINKSLLSENNDFINIQLTLTNFIEKYEKTGFLSEEKEEKPTYQNEDECFEHTINGFLLYDKSHPYYSSDQFFNRLIEYYKQLEDYEKCSQLVNTKKQQ